MNSDVRYTQPKIIELYGLPGSGKTTIANELTTHINLNGFNAALCSSLKKALSNYTIMVLRLRAALKMINDFKYVVLIIRTSKPAKDTARLKRICMLWQRLELQKHFLRGASADYIIIDQWITQELWSIYVDSDAIPEGLTEYFTSKLTTYIYVDASADLSLSRLSVRGGGHSRFDLADNADVQKRLKDGEILMKQIHTHVKLNSNNVCEVSAHESLSCIKTIIHHLGVLKR